MKDFSKLKQHLEEQGELRTKAIKELGYSQYDINQFLNESLLEKKDRGLYILKTPKQTEENSHQDKNATDNRISELKRKGTYELSKRFYYEAKKIFEEILTINPNDSYAYHCLSLIAAKEKDFDKTFEYLKISYEYTGTKENGNIVLLFYALSHLIEISPEFLKKIESNLSPETLSEKYFATLIGPLKKGDTEKCQKRLSYFLKNDFIKKRFRLNNFYLDLLLSLIKEKKNEQTPPSVKEQSLVVETLAPTVIVPEVSEKQLVINSLLLEAINTGNFGKAREMLGQGNLTNQTEIIDVLLTKLINIQSIMFSQPCKVVGVEPVRVVEEKSIDEDIINTTVPPAVQKEKTKDTVKNNQDTVAEPVAVQESLAQQSPIPQVPEEQETRIPLEEQIEKLYLSFKEASERFDFDDARKCLVRYELAYKKSGKYRNIKYHYDRLEINKEEYNRNPEQYKKKLETIDKIKKLIALKQYDAAIVLLEEIKYLNPKDYQPITLMASIYNRTSRYEDAYAILQPYFGICEEPTFFYQMAQASFNIEKYEEALECCIQYNERRPSQNGSVYLLMANCYNRMRKYSKEVKALRKAEEINKLNGYKYDLKDRIEKAEISANRKHGYTLAKKNKRDVYDD